VLLIVFNIGGVIATTQMDEWGDAPLYVAVSLFLALHLRLLRLPDRGAPVDAATSFSAAGRPARWSTGMAGDHRIFRRPAGRDIFTLYGRAKGMFEDPNVLAPYLVLPALWCLHTILTGRLRADRAVDLAGALVVLLLALFLSFSRAGWGLIVLCSGLLAAGLYLGSASGRFRLRIVLMSGFRLAIGGGHHRRAAIRRSAEAVQRTCASVAGLRRGTDGPFRAPLDRLHGRDGEAVRDRPASVRPDLWRRSAQYLAEGAFRLFLARLRGLS
jgi:hypothetical protein